MLSGVGSAWADTYVFDQNAQRVYETNLTKFTFGDKVIQLACDRTDAKPQQDANDEIQKGIKYSSGRTYTFTFPTDEIVKRIVFTGFARSTEAVSYINKINGNVRNDGNNEPGSTQFPHKQTSDDDENVISPTGTYEVNFYSTRQNTVSFEIAGVETNLIITVVTEKPSQKFNVTYSVPDVYGANPPEGTIKIKNLTKNTEVNTYTDNGETKYHLSGTFEANNGDEIEVTAWDFCANTAQGPVPEGRLILEGWKINNGQLLTDGVPMSGISWWHGEIKYRFKVTSDMDFKAVYMLSYKLHFPDNTGHVGDADNIEQREYTYVGGTAHAFIGAEKIWDGSSAFRGNTSIVATATPASGYDFDHWEGYLKGAGNDPVWTSDGVWSKENPFTFKSDGEMYNYAWGNDIYIKPVFKSLGVVVGPDAMNNCWNQKTSAACSPDTKLEKMHECTYEFNVRNGGKTDPWYSWVISANKTENNYDPGASYFTLRPDNDVWNGWTEKKGLNTLALVGGALDFETFKRDLDGAHVTAKISYDGEKVFVYQVIENNGRTYTYYYPYEVPAAEKNNPLYLHLGVDHSQLTNYSANVVRAFRFNSFVNPTGAGNVVFTNEQGTQILEGSIVGKGTKVIITATATNSDYTFKTWGSGFNNQVRDIIAGYSGYGVELGADVDHYNFTATFEKIENYITDWTLKTEAGSGTGDVYYSNGTLWNKDSDDKYTFKTSNIPNEFDGAYKDASGTPMPGMAGLLFNNKVRIAKNGGNEVMLYAGYGIVKIPVKKGEIVTFNLKNDNGSRTSQVRNADGTTIDVATTKDFKEISVVANADGYIEILPVVNNASNLRMSYIHKTAVRDFTFADGYTIPAQSGTDNYINNVVATVDWMKPIVETGHFTWTSSNPAEVYVDPNTGRVVVNNSFSGSVQITATLEAVLDNGGNVVLPSISKTYTLVTSTNQMKFEYPDHSEELKESGSVVYWQDVTWTDVNNIPEGEIHYSVVSSSASSYKITEDEDGNPSSITVVGEGVTVVKATCGALNATYTLRTHGLAFAKTSDIYNFSGTYTQTVNANANEVTYSIIQKHGAIKDVNLTINNGEISGLPKYDDNKGGAIVVQAESNSSHKKATYVLTIPYKEYTWNFYDEQATGNITSIQTLNADKHFTFGDLAPANPGAADQVPSDAEIPNDGKGVFPGQYVTSDFTKHDAIKKMLNWQNGQNGDLSDSDPHKYWDYTFKTLTHQDKTYKKPIEYCNEPLFSYKGAVNGNNVRIVNETQGLIFDCAANAFGVNDNNGYNTTKNASNSVDTREQDRAILIYKGNSFTIPFVKKNHYVKLHWYRHSTNAGDIFSVTNAKDLDGTIIDPTHKLRFTGSHYESKSEYRGYTILQAAADGPMTITNNAPSSWIEIYTIELTDKYSTELKVEYAHVQKKNNSDPWGGPMNSGYTNNWMFNMHDNIVGVVRKVGDSANNHQYTASEISTTDWASLEDYNNRNNPDPKKRPTPVDNCATIPTQRVGDNPIIYIGSFPGYTNGWNGWSLDVEAFPVTEDARNLKIGLQKELVTRVGNRLTYGVHALTNFEGTGTAHVIVRTKSGSVDGSPRYTLDQQEAYFPVGEYHPQEYPYTWDFTNYNMNDASVADQNTYDMTRTSTKESYGGWKPANGARKMHTIANNENQDPATRGVAATVPYSLEGASNSRRYNKFLFADGSQFTVNQGHGASEIRETDGLRMTIGADMSSYQDRAVTLYEDGSGIDLGVEGATITVPEVDQNYYIFVRSANKPTSVVGAEDLNETEKIESTSISYSTFDNNVEVAFKQGDIPANVWIYKQSAKAEKTDVVITPNGPVEGIGVTNYMKPMVQFKNMARATYTTDARAERIDYHNTGFFTNHDLKAYVANQNARMDSNDANSKDSENGTITLTEIKVIPKQGKPLDGSRGLMLEDVVAAPKAGAVNTARPLLPLFVPACNLQDESLVNNKFVGCITETTIPASTSTTRTYTLTNQYYDWDWANKTNVANPEHHVASDAAFYINRSSITSRKNSAYLSVSVPQQAGVKQIYMIFGEDDMEDATAIDGLEIATSEDVISQPVDVYTLTGVKLNGMPTQKGVYVINGKKVFVK